MKNIKQKIVATALLLLCAVTASAWDFEVDGIFYNELTPTTCEVTYSTIKYESDIIIPSIVTDCGSDYNVVGIGSDAFRNCYNVTSVTIPESVTYIKERAFEYTWLTSITIPSSVKSITGNPFGYCSSLADFEVETNNPAYTAIDGVLFSKDTKTIVAYPAGKVKTQKIYDIPDFVATIQPGAFKGCRFDCINIPLNFTSIEENAFASCGAKSVFIPSSVTSIGAQAFYDSDIESIDIPNSVKCIGESVFARCEKLRNVTLSSSIRVIPREAFDECRYLSSIIIPKSVTKIEYSAFHNCENLVEVHNRATVPQELGTWAFTVIDAFTTKRDKTLYVPMGTREYYMGVSDWKSAFKYIKEEDLSDIHDLIIDVCDESNSSIYDIYGRRHYEMQNGLIIINGKKVFVK